MNREEQIKQLCKRFMVEWLEHPELRFGQFMLDIANEQTNIDPFYITDEQWMMLIMNYEFCHQ